MDAPDKKTILLVEDEAAFRTIYQDMLDSGGFQVLTAADGEAGLQMALSEKPDLVLLDLNLPKLHGFEVLKGIRANKSTNGMPVIILTVQGSDKDIKKGIDLGATDYLVKGLCTPVETLRRINTVLSGVQEKKTIFKIEVKERLLDGMTLEQEIGTGIYYCCPRCRLEIYLELTLDTVKEDKHFFSARFVCPNCQKQF
jgi:two-component system alkaline phosphatase synthesis response regulator PhoP